VLAVGETERVFAATEGVSPRDSYSHGLVSTMQLIWRPPVDDDQYIAERGWERAVLGQCPFHTQGGCGAIRHGSYGRLHPSGLRVPRFLCPVEGKTISLLPAFVAARLPGTLAQVEASVDAVERAGSVAAAAEELRPADAERAVTSISAARWVRRRLHAVRAALLSLVTLVPELFGCAPTLGALRVHLGVTAVLVELRRLGAAHLGALGPPLGLCARSGR